MSNGENWTKGPWYIGNHPNGACYYIGPTPEAGREIATVYRSRENYEEDAITNLIASAPELYEALKSLCKFCDEAAADAFDDGETEAARQALAKARGEINQQEND